MAPIDYRYDSVARSRVPGVYLEEVPAEIDVTLRTGVPLFVGFVEKESPESVEDIGHDTGFYALTHWEQFRERIGRPVMGGFLAYAVRGFFENGGAYCVVIPLRVPPGEPDSVTFLAALRALFTKDSSGLRGILENIEDTDLVCVPDVMIKHIRRSPEIVFELQNRILEYCKDTGNRFAILDAPLVRGGESLSQMGEDTESVIQHRKQLLAAEGALYFPWIRVAPIPENPQDFVPPCGHMAGIYARTDTEVGVHKAPANEIVEGALDLEVRLTDKEQVRLNDVGVNCLRSFPTRGIRVWGARTLSAFPNWRYVNVRRLFLTLVRWIERNMNELVFETNDPVLWQRVRDKLGAYCYELFVRGALKGSTPAEAFFVKCDAEINPLDVREAGQLICDVGLAPLTPAEFIVLRISKSTAGATVVTAMGA
jgi:hypothetical protein